MQIGDRSGATVGDIGYIGVIGFALSYISYNSYNSYQTRKKKLTANNGGEDKNIRCEGT